MANFPDVIPTLEFADQNIDFVDAGLTVNTPNAAITAVMSSLGTGFTGSFTQVRSLWDVGHHLSGEHKLVTVGNSGQRARLNKLSEAQTNLNHNVFHNDTNFEADNNAEDAYQLVMVNDVNSGFVSVRRKDVTSSAWSTWDAEVILMDINGDTILPGRLTVNSGTTNLVVDSVLTVGNSGQRSRIIKLTNDETVISHNSFHNGSLWEADDNTEDAYQIVIINNEFSGNVTIRRKKNTTSPWTVWDTGQFVLMDINGDALLRGNLALDAGKILTFGGDTNIYRTAANNLKTDDKLTIGSANGLELSAGSVNIINSSKGIDLVASTADKYTHFSTDIIKSYGFGHVTLPTTTPADKISASIGVRPFSTDGAYDYFQIGLDLMDGADLTSFEVNCNTGGADGTLLVQVMKITKSDNTRTPITTDLIITGGSASGSRAGLTETIDNSTYTYYAEIGVKASTAVNNAVFFTLTTTQATTNLGQR